MFSNLHPLILMEPKEVRKATRLFAMLNEHESTPLMSFDPTDGVTNIDSVYQQYIQTSGQLNEKLQGIALCVLEREVGLRPGMIIKISNDNSTTTLEIESLRLAFSLALSPQPNDWEWRLFGKMHINENSSALIECPLNGNISIERLGLNGRWIKMNCRKTRSIPSNDVPSTRKVAVRC